MTGLGCQLGGFTNGIGSAYPFRGITYHGVRVEALEKELRGLRIPGIDFRRVSVPNAKTGQPGIGLYVEITDWDQWRPTELSLQLMRLACKYDAQNPFASAQRKEVNLFLKLMGSTALYADLAAHGSRTRRGGLRARMAGEERHLPAAEPEVLALLLERAAGPRAQKKSPRAPRGPRIPTPFPNRLTSA